MHNQLKIFKTIQNAEQNVTKTKYAWEWQALG